MFIDRNTWFRFCYLAEIVKEFLTSPQEVNYNLDNPDLVHAIVDCLPSDEELSSEIVPSTLAQLSIDKLGEAKLIKIKPDIHERLESSITAFRKGELDSEYLTAKNKALKKAVKEGYFI